MLRRVLALAGVIALFVAGQAQAEMKTITDDMGRQVTLDLPIKKAAVFNPWNAELFRAIGGAGSIAGLDAGTAANPGYWPAALTNPDTIIGQGQTAPNYERIVALKPDVVVIPANGVWQEAEAKLKPFGIPVLVMTGFDPVKHVQNAKQVGLLVGKPEQAQKVADFYQVNMDKIAERLKGVPPRKIYLENWTGIVSPLPTSGWDNMMRLANGANIFSDIDVTKLPTNRGTVNDFQIDPEQVIVRNPEVIFKMGCCNTNYPAPPAGSLKTTADEVVARPGWNSIQAVKNKQVYVIGFFEANVVSKMIAAVYLAKAMYPDRFTDMDPEALMKTWLQDFQGVPYTSAYSYAMTGRAS